jgi:signal transduction histidine kinase
MLISKQNNFFLSWWHQLPIRIRGTLIIAIPVTCLFAALSAFAWLKVSLVEDEKWVQHTQVVRLETKRLLNALIDAETGVRGYGLTLRPEFLNPYEKALEIIPDSLNKLENLVTDNPQQTRLLQDIKYVTNENLAIFYQKTTLQSELKRIRGRTDLLVPAASLYEWLEEGKATMDEARLLIDRFAENEEKLLQERQEHQNFYRQVTWAILCIAAGLGAVGFYLSMHLFYQLEKELANRELNLQASNQQLQVVCQQLQRFTANASHELRTPLAAVLSNAQVGLMALADLAELEERETSEDLEEGLAAVRNRLQKIVKLAKNMSNLVGQLLFLARHEGGLSYESFQRLNLTEMLANLLADFRPEAEANQLQLKYAGFNDAVMVNGENILLPQAIANLLNNACRYTPSGGIIEVSLLTEEQRAIVAVKDTGIGISEAEIAHIFERFYRVDPKGDRHQKGFGLGLAITQQIVQLHGGTIEVFSTLNQGSTFKISLPLSRV